MDCSAAVRQLPALHAVALRLHYAGMSDHVIAIALGVDDDQVPLQLQIAHAKLGNLLPDESHT
jgi:hypothetical protein